MNHHTSRTHRRFVARILFALAFATVTLALVACGGGGGVSDEELRARFVGKPAPEFEAETLDGQPFRLADQQGKTVLLVFWASWCGPCTQQIPHLKRVHERYGSREDFTMVGVSLDDERAHAAEHVASYEMRWPQLFHEGRGWDNPVSGLYGVRSIPSIWLIDKAGVVVDVKLRGPGIERAVVRAIGG